MNKEKIKEFILNNTNFNLIRENNLYDSYIFNYKNLDLNLHITDSYIDFTIYHSYNKNHIYFKSCNINNTLYGANIEYFIEDLKKLMIFIYKYADLNFTCKEYK